MYLVLGGEFSPEGVYLVLGGVSAQGGVCSGGCLFGGWVCSGGVSAPGGWFCSGAVSAPGGACLLRGVYPSMH